MHSTGRKIAAQVRQLPKVNTVISGSYNGVGGAPFLFTQKQSYATPPTATAPAVCPHLMESRVAREAVPATATEIEWDKAVPYEKIPGPRPIPILGNTFR